jgi:iron-sulfur cluster insertion protein
LPLRRRIPISLDVSEPDISLTENAAKRVAAIAARQSKPPILRLAVDGGGCAGFTYKFDLAEASEDGDAIAETNGVKLIVDPVSLDLVRGCAVDFVEDLGGAAFKVTNPNAASGCGCGSSFSV